MRQMHRHLSGRDMRCVAGISNLHESDGTHTMQTCDLTAGSFFGFVLFFTSLVGNINKPGDSTFYVLLIHTVITGKSYAQMSADNIPSTHDP